MPCAEYRTALVPATFWLPKASCKKTQAVGAIQAEIFRKMFRLEDVQLGNEEEMEAPPACKAKPGHEWPLDIDVDEEDASSSSDTSSSSGSDSDSACSVLCSLTH